MTLKMIFIITLLCLCLTFTHAEALSGKSELDECLTGYMTDLQSWVKVNGVLNHQYVDMNSSIDLSYVEKPLPILQQKLKYMRSSSRYVKYLSLAKCGLTRVPLIFQQPESMNHDLSETVQYLSFYGNNFISANVPGKFYDEFLNATGATEAKLTFGEQEETPLWSSVLETTQFPKLKELDLRSCSIQILTSGLFRGMPNLEALYISENKIYHIHSEAFSGLSKLLHLDFSRNIPFDEDGNLKNLASDSYYPFENLTSLTSLDLSHTKLTSRNIGMISGFKKSLNSLSICNTSLVNIDFDIFNQTSIEILDISRNNGILGSTGLRGLRNTLVVLNARDISLQSVDIFRNFKKLEILQLVDNEITNIRKAVAYTLENLQILDLNKNRFISWFRPIFSLMPKLRYLSLRDNNINVITDQMMHDFKGIDYLALSQNSIVCNCLVKDFYKMAAINEKTKNDTKIQSSKKQLYHTGFNYYNKLISKRKPVLYTCVEDCDEYSDTGRFRVIDQGPGTDSYSCLYVPDSKAVMFAEVASCNLTARDILDYEDELSSGRKKLLALLAIPCLLVPLLFIFVFRRNLKYCLITMRNSAMLSMINNKEAIDDGTIFNYDVFVSYCNEDRGWVLDHLLPHMEAECSISACLHERDFQVGLSILENIVSCMDRSRSIMLIISQRFLLSQWCQFEMHLAQHRLLETRREDLILVLLEDIPRRLRPNTLHYLMLTKTYIVWPKTNSERAIFWRRMKKSLLSQKTKPTENVSLA